MFCRYCGKEINNNAIICVHCGCENKNNLKEITDNTVDVYNEKNWIVAVILSWFFGIFGAHRFYTGHIAIAIIQLFTLGGLCIWAMIDFILICFNQIRDINGHKLKNYNCTAGILFFVVGTIIFIVSFISGFIEGMLT